MEESNVPCGPYKYTGTDWIQYFSKSRYDINTNNSTGMPERQPKMETGMKTLFFFFKSNLCAHCGARTHDPKIQETHASLTEPAMRPWKHFLRAHFNLVVKCSHLHPKKSVFNI